MAHTHLGAATAMALSIAFPQYDRIKRYRAFRCLQMLDTYVASILGVPRIMPTSVVHGDLAQNPNVAQELQHGYGVEGVTEAHRWLMVNLGIYLDKTYFNNKTSIDVDGTCYVHSNDLKGFLDTLKHWRLCTGSALHYDLGDQPYLVTDAKYVTQIRENMPQSC